MGIIDDINAEWPLNWRSKDPLAPGEGPTRFIAKLGGHASIYVESEGPRWVISAYAEDSFVDDDYVGKIFCDIRADTAREAVAAFRDRFHEAFEPILKHWEERDMSLHERARSTLGDLCQILESDDEVTQDYLRDHLSPMGVAYSNDRWCSLCGGEGFQRSAAISSHPQNSFNTAFIFYPCLLCNRAGKVWRVTSMAVLDDQIASNMFEDGGHEVVREGDPRWCPELKVLVEDDYGVALSPEES